MPTPRHITEVSKQIRTSPGGDKATWIPAVVVAAGSNIANSYTVSLNGVRTSSATARSVIDPPIEVGQLVWVVDTKSEFLIVGVQ